MLIGRHSFIRQSKLSDVAGRIDYISNPKRQEYLYTTYQTEGATQEFWKNLARENQLDFKASGSAGKCIEGREFIIALPESFVQYRADDVVRLFTETFHKRYGVECSAALHHNKTKTNYHIHLVFSERKMLEQPEVKIATCILIRAPIKIPLLSGCALNRRRNSRNDSILYRQCRLHFCVSHQYRSRFPLSIFQS